MSGPGAHPHSHHRDGAKMAVMSRPQRVRFRYSGALVAAAAIGAIGALPLAGAGWRFVPVLLVPLLVGGWAWRAGTDAGPDGLRLRAALGGRRIAWDEVAEFGGDHRGRAVVRLVDGRLLALPAVCARDLPKLAAASGPPGDGAQ